MSKPQNIVDYIEQSGLKKGYIAYVLGISRTALYNKLKGKTPFRMSEANILCDLLGIPNNKIREVFLMPKG